MAESTQFLIACGCVWLLGSAASLVRGKKRFAQLSMIVGLSWLVGHTLPSYVASGSDVYASSQVKCQICAARQGSCPPSWRIEMPPIQDNKALRTFCDSETPPPGMFRGFESSPQQHLFPWLLLTLGTLLFVLRRVAAPWRSAPARLLDGKLLLDALPVSFVLFALMRWTHFYRLLPSQWENRSIFSFVHPDVSLASSLVNDGLYLLFAFVLVLVCLDARSRVHAPSVSPEKELRERLRDAHDVVVANYSYWKVTSVGLALAFLYLTYVYWDIINDMKDRRYLLSAVLTHALWLGCWVVVSMPLVMAWREWRRVRTDVAFAAPGDAVAKALHDLDIKPIGTWSFLGAVTTGLVTFLMPPAQTALQKLLNRVASPTNVAAPHASYDAAERISPNERTAAEDRSE
ncbi:MAG: hypothetical protein ABW352_20305 [Polyangiales bacterium]